MISSHWFTLRSPRAAVFPSVLPAEPECLSDKGEDVRVLQDGLGGGFTCSVSAAGVDAHHQRLTLHGTAAHAVLQGGAVFQGVEGNHAVVVVCGQEQDGGVGGAGVWRRRQVVKRWIPGEESETKKETKPWSQTKVRHIIWLFFFILDEPLELFGVVRTAVVSGPGVADSELVELQHIHDPDLCHSTAKQVWTLVHTCSCKKYVRNEHTSGRKG